LILHLLLLRSLILLLTFDVVQLFYDISRGSLEVLQFDMFFHNFAKPLIQSFHHGDLSSKTESAWTQDTAPPSPRTDRFAELLDLLCAYVSETSKVSQSKRSTVGLSDNANGAETSCVAVWALVARHVTTLVQRYSQETVATKLTPVILAFVTTANTSEEMVSLSSTTSSLLGNLDSFGYADFHSIVCHAFIRQSQAAMTALLAHVNDTVSSHKHASKICAAISIVASAFEFISSKKLKSKYIAEAVQSVSSACAALTGLTSTKYLSTIQPALDVSQC
jgi:hypothetical protein